MVSNVLRRRTSEKINDGSRASPPDSEEEFHVLVVDDSLVDRKLIKKLLKLSSCKVTTVDNGRKALQLLGLDEEKSDSGFNVPKIDLIITYYCMPGMTCYELLKKLKQDSSNFRDIPVVILSSENILSRINRCKEEGAYDFITKPMKLSDVKKLKDEIIRRYKNVNDDDMGNQIQLGDCFDLWSSSSMLD